jgi:hypothetical protein
MEEHYEIEHDNYAHASMYWIMIVLLITCAVSITQSSSNEISIMRLRIKILDLELQLHNEQIEKYDVIQKHYIDILTKLDDCKQ